MSNSAALPQANILHLQRLSTEDGPGIRTTIFFKGCSLNCVWCHNPESIPFTPQLQWLKSRCIGCQICLHTCTHNALGMQEGEIQIDRERCVACGACARECPGNALEILGSRQDVSDLVAELVKDHQYYLASGGGVTASGGEPALQTQIVEEIFTQLRNLGISTALDTCGACATESFQRLLPLCDLVLFDIKLIDSQLHQRYTGSPNHLILKNLSHISCFMDQHPDQLELWIRTPLIPGATATTENISEIGHYLVEHLGNKVSRWELCAFNNLCADKYSRLGMEWQFSNIPLMTANEVAVLEQCARSTGVDPEIILATGSIINNQDFT